MIPIYFNELADVLRACTQLRPDECSAVQLRRLMASHLAHVNPSLAEKELAFDGRIWWPCRLRPPGPGRRRPRYRGLKSSGGMPFRYRSRACFSAPVRCVPNSCPPFPFPGRVVSSSRTNACWSAGTRSLSET